MEQNNSDETTPLAVDEICQEENPDAVIRTPRRKIVVEPLLVMYALAGAPIVPLQSQYMYQKIARDMGIDLHNLTGKKDIVY